MAVTTSKRKAPTESIEFDKSARADYLTGFHKRKVQRTKQAQAEAAKKAREEKISDRKRLREIRKQELEEHVEAVQAALKPQTLGDSSDEESDDSASVSEDEDDDIPRAPTLHLEEYVDEEKFTTVTVEPIDFDDSEDEDAEENERKRIAAEELEASKPKKRTFPKKEKKKKFTYLTKAERRETRRKQKAGKSKKDTEGKEKRGARPVNGTTKGPRGPAERVKRPPRRG
ncbi:nucleolar protein 12-domain-containing protein [Peziza echinospora]|nr:nucleolar protein 12-domain-containing protein [Peziza echinospora]